MRLALRCLEDHRAMESSLIISPSHQLQTKAIHIHALVPHPMKSFSLPLAGWRVVKSIKEASSLKVICAR